MLSNRKALALALMGWLLMAVALFSAYIGIPLSQSEVRHYIPLLGAVAVFSGYGLASLSRDGILKGLKIGYCAVGIIIISTAFYIPYLASDKSPVQSAQDDHDLIMKALGAVPKECVIITQESYLFDFFDRSAASIYITLPPALRGKCLYYYEGEVCWRKEANDVCKEARNKMVLSEPLLSDGRHSLYEIKGLS